VKKLQVRDKGGVDQCDGLPDRVVRLRLGDVKPRNSDERDTIIDEFLASTGATIREGSGEAYYRPSDDVIRHNRTSNS
jgi:antirestriction protein ArdC